MKPQTTSRRIAAALAVAFAILLPVTASGQKTVKPHSGDPGQWRLIGATRADHKADHDTIVVKGPADNFRKIKFKVTEAPLALQRLVVTYDNGEPDKIDVRENIAKGGESPVIDLRGTGKRSIAKIDFWYETKGTQKDMAVVTVVGMK